MGLYRNQLLPRFQNKVMDREDLREVRARVCSALWGDVLEVGFGTGLNVPHYPDGVQRIAAVEPSLLCMRIAEPQVATSSAKVELAGLRGRVSTSPPTSSTQRYRPGRCARFLTWTQRSLRFDGYSGPAARSTLSSMGEPPMPASPAGRRGSNHCGST